MNPLEILMVDLMTRRKPKDGFSMTTCCISYA
jgi:hypothetical protein